MTSLLRSLARKLSFALDPFPALKRQARDTFLSLPAAIRGPQMIHDFLTDLHRKNGPQNFLLIGANDGVGDDHLAQFIRHRGWQGIAIEPVPQYFEQYRSNYAGYPVQCLNVAVHASAEHMDFFYLADLPDHPLPPYAKGLGSFSLELVEEMLTELPQARPALRSIRVPCLSFSKLRQMELLSRLDVVVIDTEGYDGQIIRQMDLHTCRPKVIVFEHKRLEEEDRQEALRHLEKAGYQHRSDRTDVLAWLP